MKVKWDIYTLFRGIDGEREFNVSDSEINKLKTVKEKEDFIHSCIKKEFETWVRFEILNWPEIADKIYKKA